MLRRVFDNWFEKLRQNRENLKKKEIIAKEVVQITQT